MSYLVDTHYLLWSLIDPARIKKHITAILTDTQTMKYVSKTSFWEITLKFSIGKLELKGTTPEEILHTSRESGFVILDLREEDIATSHLLPFIERHVFSSFSDTKKHFSLHNTRNRLQDIAVSNLSY